jgi:hypothetical protein
LNCAQYFYLALITPVDRVNLGFTAINGADASVYYSYIEQIRQGDFFTKDVFTSEPQTRATFSWFFCLLGLIARVTTLSAPTVLRLAQLFLIGLACWSYMADCLFFTGKKAQAKRLGLVVFFGIRFADKDFLRICPVTPKFTATCMFPMDLWVPELTVFGILISFPHFVISLTLLALSLLLVLLAWERRSWGYAAASGIKRRSFAAISSLPLSPGLGFAVLFI